MYDEMSYTSMAYEDCYHYDNIITFFDDLGETKRKFILLCLTLQTKLYYVYWLFLSLRYAGMSVESA
jgi:hypothetical protein